MEKSSFFNAHLKNGVYDRTYQAEDFAKYFSTFIGNGVFPVPSNSCQVMSNDNMTITISAGLAWINGYMYQNTDTLQLNIEPADGVLNRQDRVVLRLDFVNREIKAYVLKGEYTSSDTPHAPNLTRTADIYELGLAQIDVMAGVTKITQSAINDVRWQVHQCGIVSGTVQSVDITTLYNQYKTKFEEDESNFATKANSTYANFNKKLNDSYLEFTNNFNTWFDDNTTEWSDEFTSWFDGIKKKLSDDIATSLQNQIDILNESVTHKLTKDIVKEYSGEGITSNDTSEGFIRNLKLEGNTKYRKADGSYTDTYSNKNLFDEKLLVNNNCTFNNGVINYVNTTGNSMSSANVSMKLKPNTEYSFNVVDRGGTGNKIDILVRITVGGTVNYCGLDETKTLSTPSTGVLSVDVTSQSTTLRCNRKFNIMVVEGSNPVGYESPIISLESVGEKEKNSNEEYPIEVFSCGSKNLCLKDKINWTNNHGGGSLNVLTPFLEEGKVYTIYGNNDNSSYNLHINILNYNWTIKIANGSVPFTFTYSKDMKVIQFINDTVWTPTSVSQLQIKEGENNNPTFEEYKGDKRTVLLDEPLRGIGAVKDMMNFSTNKIVKNFDFATYAGEDTTTWNKENLTRTNTSLFGHQVYAGVIAKSSHCMANTLPYNYGIYSTDVEGVRIDGNGNIQISIAKSKLETDDVAGFKKWLKNNPTTIMYQRGTPVVEDITNLIEPLSSYPNTTTMTTNNNIKANISCSMLTKEAEPLAQSFYDYYIKKLYKNAFNKNGDTMSGDINMGYNAVKTDILKNVDGETLVQKGILADGKGNTIDTTEIGNENKPVVLKTLEKAPRVNGLNFVYHEGNKPTIEELGLTDYVNKTKTMYEGRATKLVEFASEANKWGKVAEFNIKAANGCIAATFMVQTIGDNDNNSRYAIFSVNMKQFDAMGKKPKFLITTLLAKNFDAVDNIKGVLVENSSSLTKVELYIRQQTLWDGYIMTCINGRNLPDGSFTMFENLDLLDNVPTGISSTYYKPAYLQDFYINKDATLAYCEGGTDSCSVYQPNDCNVSTVDFAFTASKDGLYRFDVSLQVNTKMVVVIIDGNTRNSLFVLNNAYSGSITLKLKEGQVVKTVCPINDNAYSSIATIDGARLTITACAV